MEQEEEDSLEVDGWTELQLTLGISRGFATGWRLHRTVMNGGSCWWRPGPGNGLLRRDNK